MRPIDKIIWHHSASKWGTLAFIDQEHRAKGWGGIGYHWLILNGWIAPKQYDSHQDGLIVRGRPLDVVGTHDRGQNTGSIGICLVAMHIPSYPQLEEAHRLHAALQLVLGPLKNEGHFENEPNTPTACPGDFLRPRIDEWRAWLAAPLDRAAPLILALGEIRKDLDSIA